MSTAMATTSLLQHKLQNTFARPTDAANAIRFKSSSTPPAPANRNSVPTSTSLLEQTSAPKNMQAGDVALDMFFSGYRPLFLMDHFGPDSNARDAKKELIVDTREYMPWDVSISGLAMNPEMKSVPRPIVRHLVPFQPSPTEVEAAQLEEARNQKERQEFEAAATSNNGVKVLTFEINNKNHEGSNHRKNVKKAYNIHNDNSITEISIVVDDDFANHPSIKRSLNKIKNMLLDPADLRSGPHIVYSPTSLSFGRYVHATSVKRKRKLKMNKHKLRKRRKLQRAVRRKLKR